MEVTEETPVLELSAENKDEILQTAVEEVQTAEIQQEVEKRATELSEEIMNEVETIMTQKQEVEAESVHQQNEDNDSFEIVDDNQEKALNIQEENDEQPDMLSTKELADEDLTE